MIGRSGKCPVNCGSFAVMHLTPTCPECVSAISAAHPAAETAAPSQPDHRHGAVHTLRSMCQNARRFLAVSAHRRLAGHVLQDLVNEKEGVPEAEEHCQFTKAGKW
jgi:hypothetical protein